MSGKTFILIIFWLTNGTPQGLVVGQGLSRDECIVQGLETAPIEGLWVCEPRFDA